MFNQSVICQQIRSFSSSKLTLPGERCSKREMKISVGERKRRTEKMQIEQGKGKAESFSSSSSPPSPPPFSSSPSSLSIGMGVRELEEGRENLDSHLSLFWRCEHLSWGMKWWEDGRVWREYRGQWDRGTSWCQSPKVPTLHPQYGLKLKEETVEGEGDYGGSTRLAIHVQRVNRETETSLKYIVNIIYRQYSAKSMWTPTHTSEKALCKILLPFIHQSTSELQHRCWVIHTVVVHAL